MLWRRPTKQQKHFQACRGPNLFLIVFFFCGAIMLLQPRNEEVQRNTRQASHRHISNIEDRTLDADLGERNEEQASNLVKRELWGSGQKGWHGLGIAFPLVPLSQHHRPLPGSALPTISATKPNRSLPSVTRIQQLFQQHSIFTSSCINYTTS